MYLLLALVLDIIPRILIEMVTKIHFIITSSIQKYNWFLYLPSFLDSLILIFYLKIVKL